MEPNDEHDLATAPLISFRYPKGWAMKESVTLLAPDALCNVIASTDLLPLEMTAEEYAFDQGKTLIAEFPFFEERPLHVVEVDGLASHAYLREFTWVPRDSGKVRQLQLYGVSSGIGITATATCLDADTPAVFDRMLDVLLTLTVDPETLARRAAAADEHAATQEESQTDSEREDGERDDEEGGASA
jgi:hypothetical protein